MAPRARRGQCHGRGPRRRPAAGIAPADERHPCDRRRRHAGAGPPSPDHRVAARDPDGAGRALRGGGFGGCARRSALGGPGLRRAGFAGIDRGRRQAGGRRSARRDRRLRPQVEHRPEHAAARRPGAHPAPHHLDLGCPRAGHRRRDPVAGAGRSGATRRPRRAREGRDRGRPAAARDLPRTPDRGACGRRRDDPAALRPPRREPPGPGRRLRARPGHGPEPRGPGRRGLAADRKWLPREPGQPERRFRRGPAPRDRSRSRRCSTTPKARRVRSTRWRCSTASSTRAGRGHDSVGRGAAADPISDGRARDTSRRDPVRFRNPISECSRRAK